MDKQVLQSAVLQGLKKVVFLFLKMRGHPVQELSLFSGGGGGGGGRVLRCRLEDILMVQLFIKGGRLEPVAVCTVNNH